VTIDPKSRIVVILKNFGKTPTRLMNYEVLSEVGNGIPAIPPYPTATRSAKGALAPGQAQTITMNSNPPLPEEIQKWIQEERFRLWIHGFVTYEDVYRKPRLTTFCYSYLPRATPNEPHVKGVRLR
jgi:hypothetical protein